MSETNTNGKDNTQRVPPESTGGSDASHHHHHVYYAQSTSSRDPFLEALDLVYAAKIAQEQVIVAIEKANFIDGLASRARAEAENIHEVAESLTQTATSIAMMALNICHYSSFEDAYATIPSYARKLPLKLLLGTIKSNTGKQNVANEEPTLPTAEQDLRTWKVVQFSQTTKKEKDEGTKHKHEPETPYGKQELGKLVLNKTPRQSLPAPVDSSFRTISTTNSSSSAFIFDAGSSHLIQPAQRKSSHKFNEPYPTWDDYRVSLAATFDSKRNIPPLWENQYLGHNKDMAPRPIHDQQSWTERKNMKQFQIMLKKTCPDPNSFIIVEEKAKGANGVHENSLQHESDYDSEFELTSDSEVEDILQNKPLNRLVAQDQTASHSYVSTLPSNKKTVRAVSPLLDRAERGNYSKAADDSGSPTPKQYFQPRKDCSEIYK